jgi:integrase
MAITDTKLKALKPRDKPYIVTDADGLCVEVLPSGSIVWRYRYRLNGKREKLTLDNYPALSLKAARAQHARYRAMVADGISPARGKQAMRLAESQAESFKEFADEWLEDSGHGDKWRKTQAYWLELDIYPAIGKRKLKDIGASDILTLLDSIKKRGSPQSALRVRGIIKQVFDHAIGRQRATFNPAAQIPSRVIHKPKSRDRTLSESEIREFLAALERSKASRSNKLALRLILLTMVRKGELRFARWADIDFEKAEWSIPETKNGKPHIVYLSSQSLAILRELKTLSGDSEWVVPSTHARRKPAGETTLNNVLTGIELAMRREGKEWSSFSPHDLRRTASTILHEQGFDPLVVEKALNHSVRGVAGVYNRAQYADQRRRMLQHWGDYIDGLRSGAIIAFRTHRFAQ